MKEMAKLNDNSRATMGFPIWINLFTVTSLKKCFPVKVLVL